MAQGELPFKSMTEKELVKELERAEASAKKTRKRKPSTEKSTSKAKSSSKTTQRKARKGATKRTIKSGRRPPVKKQFYHVEVPVGAAVTITPNHPCKTAKVAKGTPKPKTKKRSKRAA